jgi:uncharacterized protein (AIM24 family)
MADFKICELEGMRWVQIEISDETVRAEAGALSYLQGDIRITAKPPSPLSALKSAISNEALVRPSYSGNGTINLESTLGGYYPFEVAGEAWILENGAYWASEGSVQLSLHRERVWTSLWAGEGFIDYQTKLTGQGRVVLNAPGPVEEIALKDERLMVEGKLVIARTEGLDYRMRRATTLVQSLFAGEARLRVYEGTGKALVCWTPYWNCYVVEMMKR